MADAKGKRVKTKSLKSKIMLYFLITMAVLFAVVGVVVIVDASSVVETLNKDLTEQVVLARADEIGKYMEGLENDIKTWAERNVITSGNLDEIRSDLKSKQETLRSDFEMVFYSDMDGNFYSSMDGTGNIADRAYFQEIVSGGQDEAVSDPVESRATGKTIFVVAHVVKNAAGDRTGVMAATVLLDTFNEVVEKIKIGEAGYPWITDGTGLVIAHPSDDIRLKLNALDSAKSGFKGLTDIGQNMTAGKEGINNYSNSAGESYYAIYAPIPETPNWSMAYSISQTEMMAPVTKLTLTILIIIAICLIIVAGVAFFVSSKLVKPIKASAELAQALAEGDLDKISTVKSKDEVGQLAGILDNEVRGAFKSIKEARVISEKQTQYQTAEVDKLLVALRRLARGELEFDFDVADGDADTAQLHALFSEIAENLGGALKEIRSYISEISTVLGEMAKGRMDVDITTEFMGEFVALKDSINAISESLNTVLGEIGTASDQVAAGTKQVSDGSQEISQGATEQASAIEELTASVTQIAEQTRQNAMSANKANELTTSAVAEAGRGNDSMKAMQQAMGEISEASSSISKIIKVIDDIAFQTNILALNAAVEAARAGVHGKGFAVVAEEVRNLAARSASAAKETTELIEGSIKKTAAGTKIADETAEALGSIVEGVETAASLVGEIANASNEQASAIAQVNRGIEQMSQVVQTNSATSEEAAAAAEELSSQAEFLKSMVSQFQLKDESIHKIKQAVLKEPKKPAALGMAKIDLTDSDFGKY